MLVVLLLLGGLVVAGLGTNLAEGRAQRVCVACLVLLLAALVAWSVQLSRG